MAKEKRVCPREQFVKTTISSGATKYGVLRSIMKHVVLACDFEKTSKADVKTMVENEFISQTSSCMLPFEAASESERMTFLIQRWLAFEKGQNPKGIILAKDFSNKVNFAGMDKSSSVHLLVKRGAIIEAIRFKYKAPEYNYKGRIPATQPVHSSELLLLQRSGEAEARKLGLDPLKTPVYGAVYYLKHKIDSAQQLQLTFESERGTNIISHCFVKSEAATVEAEYTTFSPNATDTCKKSECNDCLYYDLCHLEFEKRHLMEQPPVQLKTIDQIKLTDAQVTFVSFENGECRVNAVAGSGKTTVVALRTLALIEEGADPSKILMVTFSEKAKEEMAIRLKSFAFGKVMAGTNLDVDAVQVETFNSWGQGLLDTYYKILGFTAKPTLVDDVVKKDIIIDLLDNHRALPFDYRNPFMSTASAEGAVIKLTNAIDTMKAAHVETPQDVEEALGSRMANYAPEMLAIYNEYNTRLMTINAIDYEDQLRLLLKLADFGIFEKLPYEHLVVDEFQDSNPNQIAIIVELKKRNSNIKSLVVVGDELQAIYGFRNATPDNLVNFSSYFPAMVDIDMTANFRSQQPIIQLANKIIQKTAKLGKVIEAHKNSTNIKPAVLEMENADKELDLYTRQIKKLLKDGTAPSDIAVICRTRKELIKIQMALDKEGIPTLLKVPEIVADAPYVKAVISFAAFLKDNNDLTSLALYAKSLGQDPFDTKALQSSAESIKKAFAACKNESESIDVFFAFLKDAKEDYVAETFIEKMKGMGFRMLRQYLNYCTKYRDYKVRDTQSTSRQETDCVTLITAHSAKGLEWHTVLLSLKTFPLDEEARRLFYVGVTRAKERLLVTYTRKQTMLAQLLTA